jgi:hypothetical protein
LLKQIKEHQEAFEVLYSRNVLLGSGTLYLSGMDGNPKFPSLDVLFNLDAMHSVP